MTELLSCITAIIIAIVALVYILLQGTIQRKKETADYQESIELEKLIVPKLKDGDILVHSQNQRFIMSIYRKKNTELTIKTHCILWDKEEGLSVNKDICCYADSTRPATEKEKQKLFQAIKDNGYEWNVETKTLEKVGSTSTI